MAQKLEQGSIVFIDVPTQLPGLSPSKGTLLPLLDLIRRNIETLRETTPPLLIFDEIALFEWIGHSELDVSRFARALVRSCAKVSTKKSSLLAIHTNYLISPRTTFS
jgi:RecA-family ATPase